MARAFLILSLLLLLGAIISIPAGDSNAPGLLGVFSLAAFVVGALFLTLDLS